MKFIFTTNAEKTLSKLEKTIIQRIFKKIDFWAASEKPLEYAKKLEGHNLFRFRVGDFRIIASHDKKNDQIKVKRIAHRKEVYLSLDEII